MKAALAVLLTMVSLASLGQGKVTFGNDTNHLIILDDFGVNPPLFVPFPQAGSTNPANLSLFTAQLLAGTSPDSLSVVSTVASAGAAGLPDGRLTNVVVNLSGIPGNVPAYFQVLIWETSAGSYANARSSGHPTGHSPVFTAVPGSFIPNPIWPALPPTNSTWANSTIQVPELAPEVQFGVWIATQPGSLSAAPGARASFSVLACSDYPLNYQWQFNGTDIDGATNATYQIGAVQSSNAGNYAVRVYNQQNSLLSSNAVLTVTFPPGKVTFGNDSNHLIIFQAGYTGPTNLALFTAQLLAGTSASSMAIVGSIPAGAPGWPDGRLPSTQVILTNIPAGIPAYFQVLIWETAAGSYMNCTCRYLSGYSPIFTVVPGNLVPNPIWSSAAPALSTWANGPLVITPPLDPPGVSITVQPVSQRAVRGSTVFFNVVGFSYYPLHFQWRFNGTDIPRATDANYRLVNVQSTNAGDYSVKVFNDCESTLSSNVTLVVVVPPSILVPPRTQTAEEGSTPVLDVQASGDPTLMYQWFFDGISAVSGVSTNPSLRLPDVQASQAGPYMVVVTNAYGAATSAPALLSVIPAVERKMVPGIRITAQASNFLNLEHATTLLRAPDWTAFPTVYLTNTPQFFIDLSEPLPPQRFYRAWQSNAIGAPIILDTRMIPAIKVSGAVGSTYRIDYINQFGPTDAWVTLATVTLTQPMELYFDVSMPGQPPRLYRVVQVP